jgi:TPR repeat protein
MARTARFHRAGLFHGLFGLLAALAALSACASDTSDQNQEAAGESCGRIDGAARFSLLFFDVMGEMADACAEGDPLACNPANYVIAGLAGIVYMPMGFAIGLSSEQVEDHHCAEVRRKQAGKRRAAQEEENKETRLWHRAVEGGREARFELGEKLFKDGTPEAKRAAWYWFCLAAQQHHAEAQHRLGLYHREGLDPVQQDLPQAYLWYELAADGRAGGAANDRATVARDLTPAQIAAAERRAMEWQPDPDACNVDHAAAVSRS